MRNSKFNDIGEAVIFTGLATALAFTAVMAVITFTSEQHSLAPSEAAYVTFGPR